MFRRDPNASIWRRMRRMRLKFPAFHLLTTTARPLVAEPDAFDTRTL
jgi:hypothetical protein